VPTRNWQSK